jgi:hypothetical protein
VDLAELLQSLEGSTPQGGLYLASAGVGPLLSCALGACKVDGPDDFHKRVQETLLWDAEGQKAKGRLAYHDPEAGIKESWDKASSYASLEQAAGLQGLTPGACMDFACTLTTTKEDRDADVLECSGADITPDHALLFMHNHMLVAGKHVKVLSRDAARIDTYNSIVDSAFGRDMAQLVEFKALNISHGFIPLVFEPLKRERSSQGRRPGWHVKSYKVVETSLTPVQSNEDAVVTAYSRGKLHHPLVKSWAGMVSDKRPQSVTSGYQQAPVQVFLNMGPPPDIFGQKSPGAPRGAPGNGEPCSCHDKEGAVAVEKPYASEHSCRVADPGDFQKDSFRRSTKKIKGKPVGMIFARKPGSSKATLQSIRFPTKHWTAEEARKHCEGTFEAAKAEKAFTPDQPHEKMAPGVVLTAPGSFPMPCVEDSWEYVQCCLQDQARKWLKDNGVRGVDGDSYLGSARILATFDDTAVVGCMDYGSKFAVYQGSWVYGDDGPEFTGAPEPVDLVVSVSGASYEADPLTGKAFEDLWHKAKAPRPRISKKSRAKLAEARDLLATVKGARELSHPSRACAEKAHSLVNDVVEDATVMTGSPLEKSADEAACDLGGLLLTGQKLSWQALSSLESFLQSERQRLEAEAFG